MILPATGTLLIAEPFLKDPNFMRTVILLCRHSEADGSFGFVINSLFHKKLDELVPELKGFDLPVYKGGPVQLDTLHYIHQYPELLPDCQKITDDVFWGGDFETLKILMLAGEIDADSIRFFLGYSGWEEGQLDGEMEDKSWLTVNANRTIVFDTAIEDIWKASLIKLGGKYELMIHYPTDPQLN